MAIMDDDLVRSASAETLDKTELFVLKRKNFQNLLMNNPDFMKKMLVVTMERLRRANEIIEDLTFLDTRSRICKAIFRLSKDHGVKQRNGLLIDIKMTHQQLADIAGTVRETVTKVLLELQDEQIVSVSEKKILLMNMPKLMDKF
jgi:CRP/FNR family transcriptional regulator